MTDLITELNALAQRMAAAGETDEPVTVSLAAEEIERLRAEVERLRADNDHQRERRNAARDAIEKGKAERKAIEQERDQLKGVLQDVNTSDYRFSVEQLAAHDAEVIERAIEHFRKGYINRSIHWQELQEYANQLRQQAKEVQSER